MRGACQLANIPIEGNEIVGRESFKAADPDVSVPGPFCLPVPLSLLT